MMTAMAKTKSSKNAKPDTDAEEPKKPKQYPSREGYRSTYLPKVLFEQLEQHGKKQDRSAAYLVRKAVEAYLVFLNTGKYPDTPR